MKTSKKILAGVMSASMLFGMVAAPLASFAAQEGKLVVAAISDIEYKANAADADGLILSKSAEMLNDAIAKVNAANPDVVLVTGDLTSDGSQASHTYVAGKLAEMQDDDTRVYVIPGEKDVAKSGVNAGAINDAAFKATYNNFGYDAAAEDFVDNDDSTLSYVVAPKAGYSFVMMDSVANAAAESADSKGRGQINKTWAAGQVAAAVTYGDYVIGAAHHPSISRGSVESTLIGLIYTLAGLQDVNGNVLYDGADPFAGTDIVDKSAFSTGDMEALADAGMANIYTSHNYMLNTVTGTTAAGNTWNDYNVGSLVAASAAVTLTTYDDATGAAATTTTAVGGADLRSLVMAAQEAYTPAMIDNMIETFKGIYPNVISILRNVAPKFVDGIDFGSGISGSITGAVAKPAVKNLITDVLNVIDTWAKIEPAVNEIKTALLASTVGDKTMTYVLSDVAVQLQVNHNEVAPSLKALVEGLKADPVDTSIVEATIKDFASKLNGTAAMNLINSVLNQNLTLTLGGSHNIRELLNGPVKYFAGLATVDLWAILDGIQPYMPDGVTPVPQSAKPSEVGKPLVKALLMKSDGSAQDIAGFKAAVATGTVNVLMDDNVTRADIPVSKALVNLALRFGIADII